MSCSSYLELETTTMYMTFLLTRVKFNLSNTSLTNLNGAGLFYLLWHIIGCAFIEFEMSTDVERVMMDLILSCIVFKSYGCFVTKPLKRFTC